MHLTMTVVDTQRAALAPRHVLVEAESGTPSGMSGHSWRTSPASPGAGSGSSGGRVATRRPSARHPLVRGVVLTFTPATPPAASRGACGRSRSTSSAAPTPGAVLRLRPGRAPRRPCGAEASIAIEDPGLSRCTPSSRWTPTACRCATSVDERHLARRGAGREGTRLAAACPAHGGVHHVLFRPSEAATAAAHPDGEGHIAVNRRHGYPPTAAAPRSDSPAPRTTRRPAFRDGCTARPLVPPW